MTLRIAMWSGPRNISTAMLRSFENRTDCAVSDEPFYASYLTATGLDHPMRDEVMASQPQDWRYVAAAMAGEPPDEAPLWYQKHMAHHMLADVGLDWTEACTNVFLIRRPERVLASYSVKRAEVTLDDIGVVRQSEIFDHVAQRTGKAPIVVDTDQVLADPRATLAALCAAVGIPFSEAMLAWPAGSRASDGVWAPAWYDAVERSTGFAAPGRAVGLDDLPAGLRRIAEEAEPLYERLARYRLAV
jgi:hypothetical protein